MRTHENLHLAKSTGPLSRQAFTLVEMMVATALTLFIMAILSSAFISGLETFSKLKAIGDMEQKLRTVSNSVLEDLKQAHFDDSSRLSNLDINDPAKMVSLRGFFSIRNGSASIPEGVDLDTIPGSRATDHSMSFTVRLKGNRRESYLQSAMPIMTRLPPGLPIAMQTGILPQALFPPIPYDDAGLLSSQLAEVGYQLVPTGQITPGGTPLHALYRSQFVLPAANAVPVLAVLPTSPIQVSAVNHGLVTGANVTINYVSGVGGANGNFQVTVIDPNTFSLNGTTGSGTYTGGGDIVPHFAAVASLATPAAGNIACVTDWTVPAPIPTPATLQRLSFSTAGDVANPAGKRLLFLKLLNGNPATTGGIHLRYTVGATVATTAAIPVNANAGTIASSLDTALGTTGISVVAVPTTGTGTLASGTVFVIDLASVLANPVGSFTAVTATTPPNNGATVWLTHSARASFHPANPMPTTTLAPRGASLLATDVVSFQIQAMRQKTGGVGTAYASATGTPIVIASAAHGLATGDQVIVSGDTGNTAANGSFTVTRVNANSFSLDLSASSGVSAGANRSWVRHDTGGISGAIIGATNGTPIQITSPGHRLNTGHRVTISGVQNLANANGTFDVLVVNANAFQLFSPKTGGPVAGGAGFYNGGGTWQTEFQDMNTLLPASGTAYPALFDTCGVQPFRIHALQITIRVWDRKTNQTRQVTVMQDM